MSTIQDREEAFAHKLYEGVTVRGPFMLYRGTIEVHDEQDGRNLCGTTEAFRFDDLYEPGLDYLQESIEATGQDGLFVNAGSSIGWVTYSFAYRAKSHPLAPRIKIRQFDLSPAFTRIADAGIYPKFSAETLEAHDAEDMVEPFGHNYVRVCKDVRDMVETLPPCSFEQMKERGIHGTVIMTTMALRYTGGNADFSVEAARNVVESADYAILTDTDVTSIMAQDSRFVRTPLDRGHIHAWFKPGVLVNNGV